MHQPLLDPELPEHPLGPFRPNRTGRPRKKSPARSCRGGSTYTTPAGYVVEYCPDHPNASAAGTVLQHRLVMECLLGRLLESREVVHHRNHTRTDNRAENLELLDRREHALLHVEDARAVNLAPLTEERVREALHEKTTAEAAAQLGVHHQTLRSRFDHLLKKRRSPGGPFAPDLVQQATTLAADPATGTRKAAQQIGISVLTLRLLCRAHGIQWASAPPGRPSRNPSGSGAPR